MRMAGNYPVIFSPETGSVRLSDSMEEHEERGDICAVSTGASKSRIMIRMQNRNRYYSKAPMVDIGEGLFHKLHKKPP